MKIDPQKATICLVDFGSNDRLPPVLWQDKLISNNSPILMYQSGQGLLYVARTAAKDLDTSWADPSTHSGNRNLALLSTIAINYSFCAELFLKGLLLVTQGGYSRGHKLGTLYDGLDSKLQETFELTIQESIQTNTLGRFALIKANPAEAVNLSFKYPQLPSIKYFLGEHQSPFVDWRYYFEFRGNAEPLMFDLRFMDCFVEVLFEELGQFKNGDTGETLSGRPLSS